jgi:ribosomal protein S18 acetylase RimI-like enzyme
MRRLSCKIESGPTGSCDWSLVLCIMNRVFKLTACRTARIRETLEDFRQVRISQGCYSAVAMLVRAAKQVLFCRSDCFLYARSLEDPIPIAHSINGLVLTEAQVSDLHLFEAVQKPSDAVWYEMLLERGRTSVVALKDDQLAAYGWFTSEVDPAVERTYVPLARDEVFVFDLYTRPAFRRQGIQGVLLRHMLELARRRGYKRALSLVMVNNVPSLNLHSKLGFQPICCFTRVRILGFVSFRFHPDLFGKAGDVLRWL